VFYFINKYKWNFKRLLVLRGVH